MSKKPYLGNQLRIDGYYYQVWEEAKISNINFFYENGIFLNIGGNKNSFAEAEEYINNQILVSKMYLGRKIGWGLFDINENNIRFEVWRPSAKPYKVIVNEGKIINDTSFVITKRSRIDGSIINTVNETYYFKKFSPKPDSTNSFVK